MQKKFFGNCCKSVVNALYISSQRFLFIRTHLNDMNNTRCRGQPFSIAQRSTSTFPDPHASFAV